MDFPVVLSVGQRNKQSIMITDEKLIDFGHVKLKTQYFQHHYQVYVFEPVCILFDAAWIKKKF